MQKDNNFLELKFNLKTLIVILILGFGLYFLIPRLIGLQEAVKLIIFATKWKILIAIGFEVISYMGAAWLLGIILSRLGYKIKFFTRFKISSIAAFAMHFFPISSFGEGAVDYYFLRKQKVYTGSILLMLVLRVIITYIAFLLIFLIGLALVPTAPYIKISPKIISFALFLIIIGAILYISYLYKNKEKFRKSWHKLFRLFRPFVNKIRGKEMAEAQEQIIFEDIYQGIGLFSKKKRFMILSVIAGMIYWLGDITCFYFVFQAFNYNIHWGVLIFGYCSATLLGMISFIPGGLGVIETSMGLIYSGLGVPGSLAVMAILVFRFFSFWMWIPFGLYSYINLSRQSKLSNKS